MRGSSVASASFSLGARGFFSLALFFFSPFLFRSTLETSKTAALHFFGDPPLVFLLRFFFFPKTQKNASSSLSPAPSLCSVHVQNQKTALHSSFSPPSPVRFSLLFFAV
ncbi:hypothetical protein BT93_L4300 [Corymbia citriodora subsp. variegata]|uniref:Transmembrane protein n=1 Tax=Corymbia citriodora subsp. variegata TaxID=360336 RepID=A0A8T0CL08_CORYI|nr:hypothetical protein BT93_L4300 [Corymbia citriodora subsp. variegata]